MTAPINSAFFADPQGLGALRNEAKANDTAALKEAARQFESLFTHMLLKSMREANKSFGDPLFGSDQTEFYQDLFDEQMAVHLSQGRGLGLADMLFRQLRGTVPESSAAGAAGTKDVPNATSKLDFVQRPSSSTRSQPTSDN